MEIVRKYLTGDEISPANLRYDPECDCVQQTPDGGITWIDQPAADPRHDDGFRLPASTEPDARCDAAARIVGAWQEDLGLLFQSVNQAFFVSGVLQALLVLSGGAGVLVDLIIIALEQFIVLGVSSIESEFTEEVWDGVLCIIYQNIDADGQVSEAQAFSILSQIYTNYNATIYGTLVQLQNLFGEVLMSNAGVERTETGDCDGCVEEWLYRWEFQEADGDFENMAGVASPYGHWNGDDGWAGDSTGTASAHCIDVYRMVQQSQPVTLTSATTITRIAAVYTGDSTDHVAAWIGTDRDDGYAHMPYIYDDHAGSFSADGAFSVDGSGYVVGIEQNSCGNGICRVVEISGEGECPDFTGGERIY